MRNLLLRVDATPEIGTGHVMRCLALAQAWQANGGHAVFLSHCASDSLRERIEQVGASFIPMEQSYPAPGDLPRVLGLLTELPADWIVLDNYHFDPTYQAAIRRTGHHLLVIDDIAHWPEYHADILLNQNIHAETLSYACDPDTRLLLGVRYALLRPEFTPWRDWHRETPAVARKVLVTLGGADIANVTLTVIQALQQLPIADVEAMVVIGASNPHQNVLEAAIQNPRIRLVRNATNMPELMAWADVAVSAGGSTSWELAFMGLPSVVLILAGNQQGVAIGLEKAGTSLNVGQASSITSGVLAQALTEIATARERRLAMSRRGRALVDGAGAARLVRQMQDRAVSLRPVQAADCRLIWEWANDPMTRANSFSAEPIPWESHVTWFASKLADPQSLFYVALDNAAKPIGQIRYEKQGQEAIVSVSVAPEERGKHYAAKLIDVALQLLFESTPVTLVHAYIKPQNAASLCVFTKSGFANRGLEHFQGHPALHFTREK